MIQVSLGSAGRQFAQSNATLEKSKMIVTWRKLEVATINLAIKIRDAGLIFDQIICVARGGMAVGDILSRLFSSSTIGVICTSSYKEEGGTKKGELFISEHVTMTTHQLGKKILLIDDLVESGDTLKALKERFSAIQGVESVATAVLWKKTNTQEKPDFFVEEIDSDVWIELPAEKFEAMSLSDLTRIDE